MYPKKMCPIQNKGCFIHLKTDDPIAQCAMFLPSRFEVLISEVHIGASVVLEKNCGLEKQVLSCFGRTYTCVVLTWETVLFCYFSIHPNLMIVILGNQRLFVFPSRCVRFTVHLPSPTIEAIVCGPQSCKHAADLIPLQLELIICRWYYVERFLSV